MLKPEKPPLIIRFYNRISNIIGAKDKLDFDKLLKKAFSNTGLRFLGNDFNDEALKMLLTSINEEAQLHPFGRLMIREKLIGQLENRLWAEHWFQKYPEILDAQILPIYLITGLQRTGTTKMQRLLSIQQGARALLSWEALYPAPIKEANESIKRIKRTVRNEKAVKFISPAFQAIHPIHAEQPEEDVLLLDVHFMSSSSEAIMHVPRYASWLEKQDYKEAYHYERKLLQLLQWQRGGKFWVLKSPHHLQYLSEFTEVFPDSTIIWMHREIEACIPSFLSMLYYSRSMFKENVDKKALKSHWLNKLSLMLNGGIAFRDKNPDSIIDVNFNEFLQDENNEVIRIFDRSNRQFDDVKNDIQNSSTYESQHKYDLRDWDIDINELNIKFEKYINLVKTLNDKQNK